MGGVVEVSRIKRGWLALPLAALLAGCGSGVHYRPVSDTPVRIGQPYTVRGVTYVPAADPTYDMLGYASCTAPNRDRRPPMASISAPIG